MKNKPLLTPSKAMFVVSTSLCAAVAGCVAEPASGYREHVQVEADFQDDYDYYPEYETYYSYHRHEFVYFDGGVWVRRREPPRGIAVNVILAAPAVRLDFHDAPERHHREVIRSYPKTWRGPDRAPDGRPEHPNVEHERHEVRPEPPPVRQEPRDDAKTEHHEPRPEHPNVQPAPSEPKPEPRAHKPKPPAKKKVVPQEERPENRPDEKKDDHKDDKNDDKRDDHKGPNR